MKKAFRLVFSLTNILCLSSCDLFFGRYDQPEIKKAIFDDLVEPQADSKKESKYVTLYKMNNEEYSNYMKVVYKYLTNRTPYVGTKGEILPAFFDGDPTYEFKYSTVLNDHYDENKNSYTFVAALTLNENTSNLDDYICIAFTFDEANEYSVKKTITYNNTYHVLTPIEKLDKISTKEELANMLANYASNESYFDKSIYKDYFKYECIYTNDYINASFDDPLLPLTFTFNAIPHSNIFAKGKDYYYISNNGTCYGTNIGQGIYYYIEYEESFSYSDTKELVTYNSVTHHQNQFTEYEDNMEKILTYEDNTKTIYSNINDLKEDYKTACIAEDYTSNFITSFNDSYINLLFYDCIEEKVMDVYKSANDVVFNIEEKVKDDYETQIVKIEGKLNVVNCNLEYSLSVARYIKNELFEDSTCNVSLTFIDENYKVDIDKTKDYEVINYGENK